MGADHVGALADRHIGEGGVGADDGVLCDSRAAVQLGSGVDAHVGFDRHLDVDPGGRRVDDGHPGELVASDDAAIEFGREVGELGAVVAAGHHERVVDGEGAHGVSASPRDLHDIGQVELALRVASGQLGQRGPQRAYVEGVDPGVHLGDCPLCVGGVLFLDDRLNRSVVGPDDAAVAGRLVGDEGRQGDHGRVVAGGVCGDQAAQGVGIEQWHVGCGDDHDAVERVGQRGQSDARRIAGAQGCLLLGGDVRKVEVDDGRVDRVRHPVSLVPDDGDDVRRPDARGCVQDVPDERASGDGVQDLGRLGFHPGPGACGEDDHGHG